MAEVVFPHLLLIEDFLCALCRTTRFCSNAYESLRVVIFQICVNNEIWASSFNVENLYYLKTTSLAQSSGGMKVVLCREPCSVCWWVWHLRIRTSVIDGPGFFHRGKFRIIVLLWYQWNQQELGNLLQAMQNHEQLKSVDWETQIF